MLLVMKDKILQPNVRMGCIWTFFIYKIEEKKIGENRLQKEIQEIQEIPLGIPSSHEM